MKCYLCKGKGAVEEQKDRFLCKRCFSNIIEKRVRKNARVNEFFWKGDRILAIGELNKFFLKSMLKELPVEIFFKRKEEKSFVKKKRVNKIVLEWTLDDEINGFMKSVFEAKKPKKMPKKYVKLLKVITDKEAVQFANMNKLKFKPNEKDKLVKIFLDDVEKKHPNIKYNLLKNIDVLEEVLR